MNDDLSMILIIVGSNFDPYQIIIIKSSSSDHQIIIIKSSSSDHQIIRSSNHHHDQSYLVFYQWFYRVFSYRFKSIQNTQKEILKHSF